MGIIRDLSVITWYYMTLLWISVQMAQIWDGFAVYSSHQLLSQDTQPRTVYGLPSKERT